MIMEFSLKQISWIVIGALGIGGTGYISMNTKIDELTTKVAVIHNEMNNMAKQMDRIETTINTTKGK